jgi:hypothetical protein
VPGENNIHEAIISYERANLPDMTGQIATELILKSWCENPVAVCSQEFHGSIPTSVGQVLSRRKIISFRQ